MDIQIQGFSTPIIAKFNRPIANFHPTVWGNNFLKYSSNHMKVNAVAKEQPEQLKEEVRKKLLVDKHIEGSSASIVSELNRPNANFHPTIWGNYFLKYSSDNTEVNDVDKEQHEQLKEEVRKKLLVVNLSDEASSRHQLKLIDAIQRLGVAYHFESEIDVALNKQMLKLSESAGDHFGTNDDDLYIVSLYFQLLRQHGHRVSCGVFDKFLDNEGRFKETLMNDLPGLISLYESAHMRVHNEDVLEEALKFTTTNLEKVVNSSSTNPTVASHVVHTLNQPIRKSLTRLEARRHFIPFYQQGSHDEALLKFAKLDFNILQKLHQKELSDITRWWMNLNVAEKLPFARDRLVEGYFWILSVYFEPQYLLARRILTKLMAMVTIIDDTYDSYGTLEELTLFKDAVERWDIDAANRLPEYMQFLYRTLLDLYSEAEKELAKEETSYRINYAKQAVKQLVRAYYDEVVWYNKGYVPTVEEYMKVALVSIGYILLATNSFVGMGPEQVTIQVFDWVSSNPLMLQAASLVCRLMDDIAGHEEEKERGHVSSAIECYMKQYSATKEEAIADLNKRITDAWKDMNQECLAPTAAPMVALERVLNLARFVDLMYKDGDGFTNSKTLSKDFVTALLIEDFPI